MGAGQVFTISNVSASNAGTDYTLTVSKNNCVATSTNFSVSITNAPLANFNGTNNLCEGQNLSLVAIETGATYSWKKGANEIGTAQTLSISNVSIANTGSDYTLTVNKNGCQTISSIFAINVNTPPLTTFTGTTTLCSGTNLILSATESNATYLWKKGNSVVGIGQVFSISNVTPNNAGIDYTLIVSKNGCEAISNAFTVRSVSMHHHLPHLQVIRLYALVKTWF